eukprot:CAMPEP_0194405578 /NCGR_PEP_ID=MMETSP0176-20130528/3938_1 /TAXON_ID=216777 /ORGANISM="Proboscia alata, Strain PI-D3" /LENGTH=65 /DNA_ID=CAMNT_0039204435 /DNA_START=25 /DNA_END=220 /DNA_ORIENTATION=-
MNGTAAHRTPGVTTQYMRKLQSDRLYKASLPDDNPTRRCVGNMGDAIVPWPGGQKAVVVGVPRSW